MKVGVVKQLRRYPVKSMEGEVLSQCALDSKGIPGDRAWAVRDEVRGGIRGAKAIPALMKMQARYPEPPAEAGQSVPAEITLIDGTTVSSGAPDASAKLSASLGHEVTLWPLLPADSLDHYRRGAPSHEDFEQEMRAVFGRLPGEPLPDLTRFPEEILEFESPPGTYFDAFPLLLLTQASLQTMAAKAQGSDFDVRRFRPNLLIEDTPVGADFPEQAWHGRRIRVGDAVVEITMECPRCVMTTVGFADLPKDPAVMRSLVREAQGNLGVYAKVETPGAVKTGDTLELLD